MIKHTPGPWRMSYDCGHYVEVEAREAIGRVCTIESTPNVGRLSDPLANANARLIAAAPEMLEALKAVVSVADRKTVEFDAARAAIAKAEGK